MVSSQSPRLRPTLAVTLRRRQLHQPDIPTLNAPLVALQHYPRLLLRPRDRFIVPVPRGPTFLMLDQHMRRANFPKFSLDMGTKLFGVGACGRLPLRLCDVGVEVVGKLFGVGPANFPGRGEAGGLEVGVS